MTDTESRPRRMSIADFGAMVGHAVAPSPWIEVGQDRIDGFADITGDRQWIHLDAERAQKESPYGATIAHGFLTLSLLSQMFRSTIEVVDARATINYGLNRVRFPSAVKAGSRIRASISVQTCKVIPEGAEVTFFIAVECAGTAKPCCIAECVLHYSR